MFKFIDNRCNTKFKPYRLYDLSKGNSWLLQRMSLLRLLDTHRGCVNTISWDDKGEVILSGSDDHNLILSNAFSGMTISQLHTSHRANIFSAKFLPESNNGKIISCSGNGLVLYTDVEHHTDLERRFSFHCHEGTCFEVLTIPGCSNTFLSCGEDGTVRCIDLRIKSSCFQTNCKEDVLLNMGQAVTSMAVNSVKPNHLAASTPDSTIRVYDRRMLGDKSKGSISSRSDALIMRLIPSSLDGKNRRATFIDYNSSGTQILASYSAENLYLFDLQDSEEFSPASANYENAYDDDESCSGPTLKRLRLRGDWSDTGPLALPESELRYQAGDVGQARPTLHSTLMQRMTDVLSTMLQNPSVREAARIASRNREGGMENINDNEGGNEIIDNEEGNEIIDNEEGNQNIDNEEGIENTNENEGSDGNSEGRMEEVDVPVAFDLENETLELGASGFNSIVSCSESASKNINVRNDTSQMDTIEPSSSSAINTVSNELSSYSETSEEQNRVEERTTPDNDFSPMQTDAEDSKDTQSPCNISFSNNESAEVLSCETESLPSENITETTNDSPCLPSTSSGGASNSRTDSSSLTESSGLSDEPQPEGRQRSSARQRMARAIDKVVRSVRKKEARRLDDPVYRKVPFGKEIRQYKGHRNARTMIKEACFWGKDHVMSGSDCGRVFVWEKNTGRLVMLWEADRHVVNCLQPHPTLPVLATCGIDYDVKVWAPVCKEPYFDEVQSESIIQRNDAIQAEMRDTVTVPAAFMIRMLASLNQIRQDRARQREAGDE